MANLQTVLTSRQLNRRPGQARQLADEGPVSITERGKPAYVLMTAARYEQLLRRRGLKLPPEHFHE